MAIAEGITAAKAAFDVSRTVLDLVRRPDIDSNAVHMRLIELQSLILSAQKALGDAQEENRELKETVEQLNHQTKLRASVLTADGAYWTRLPEGTIDGPFCTVCLDDQVKLIRMLFVSERVHQQNGLLKVYKCPFHDENIIKLSADKFAPPKIISAT